MDSDILHLQLFQNMQPTVVFSSNQTSFEVDLFSEGLLQSLSTFLVYKDAARNRWRKPVSNHW
uniref:Uncharacterized protein n=1 Tax=Arundo donax TaxID=35708 RepID=A0A0A9ASD4_ARUDO